ncbi:MAG: single-stranded DNA-binding protein [Solirubrobacteraceae bacterium]
MTVNLNQVAVTGNLTRDPVLVELPSGHVICEMQLASHRRSRNDVTGAWEEWADFFTVKAFGFQARTTHQHLCRGQGVAISGRLSSRRTHSVDPQHQWAVEIIAEAVQFLARPASS